MPTQPRRRSPLRWRRLISGLFAAALLIAACGDDDGGSAFDLGDSSGQTATDADDGDDAGAPSGGAISSIADAESGIVRIVATGSFVDPEVGLQLNAAGSGSGFIIDPSGIVVTNNHVVTGAATLDIYVGGSDDPVNARLLGVSECADLAVVDLQGDGYPYFDWFDGEIDVNLDVRSAGYPLGDPEFTLTRGIVSKAAAGGETQWASVDEVLEHDARINPGNSGGPLLAENGQVVGVNYAGREDTDQNFAISAPLAERVVEQLREGTDVQSLGINGQAVFDEAAGVSGVWVASVASGSPADDTGIQPGDIITRLENLVIGTDGTMKEYCDVLQTKGSDSIMKVEVLRYSTEEVLEGEFNGDELAQSFSFSQTFDDEVADGNGGGGDSSGPSAYADYQQISDNSGVLSVEVPVEWSDVDPTPTDAGEPYIAAAPSLSGYTDSWEVPGMTFVASASLAAESDDALLDTLTYSSCTSEGRQPYEDQLYTGSYEFSSNCGGTDTAYVTIVARPADNSFVALVGIQVVSDADLGALDQILRTFVVQL